MPTLPLGEDCGGLTREMEVDYICGECVRVFIFWLLLSPNLSSELLPLVLLRPGQGLCEHLPGQQRLGGRLPAAQHDGEREEVPAARQAQLPLQQDGAHSVRAEQPQGQ